MCISKWSLIHCSHGDQVGRVCIHWSSVTHVLFRWPHTPHSCQDSSCLDYRFLSFLLLSVKLSSVLTSCEQLGSVEDHPHLVALWHKCHNTCSFIIKKNLKTQKMKNELILGTSAYGLKRNSTRLLNSCFSDVWGQEKVKVVHKLWP